MNDSRPDNAKRAEGNGETPSRKHSPTKWIAYDRLLEAMNADGCSICGVVARQCIRSIEVFFGEGLLDPDTRAGLSRSYGLCNLHAWTATRILFSDSGLAIVYEDLIGQLLPHLAEVVRLQERRGSQYGFARFWRRTAPDVLPVTAPCPICSANAQTARHYLRELLDFFNDPELQAAYSSGFGICLRHLQQASQEFPDDPQLSALFDAERKKLAALQIELQEFGRKRDYRFWAEPKGREQTSWLRAVEKFTGKREAFSNSR